MYGRLLSRFARPARQCWKVDVRGKKDMPIWRGPPFADLFRRPSYLDDPWFRHFPGSGFRAMDDFFRENMRRMDAMMRMPPWRMMEVSAGEFGSRAEIIRARVGKDGMHIEMDVSEFGHEDINIKLSGEHLVVSGKHSSKQDEHGFVSREFTREFLVPENVDTESLACRLTDEGHLIISAKVKGEPETSRDITIERESPEESSEKPKEEKD